MLSCCAKMNTALNSYLFLNLDILFSNVKNIFIFNEGIQRKKELIYFYWLISIVLRLWFSFLSTSTILKNFEGPSEKRKFVFCFSSFLRKVRKCSSHGFFYCRFNLNKQSQFLGPLISNKWKRDFSEKGKSCDCFHRSNRNLTPVAYNHEPFPQKKIQRIKENARRITLLMVSKEKKTYKCGETKLIL